MERLGSRGQEATERTAPEGKSSCFATADGLMCCTCLDTRCQLEGKQAEHDTVAMPIYTTQSPANHEALCCKQQSSPCTLASDPTWRAGTAFGCLKASTLPSLASGVMAATRPRLNTEAERRGPRSCCAASPSSPTLCRARLGEAGSSSSLQAEPPRDRPGRGHTECELQGRGRAFSGMCACVVYMCGSDRDAGLMSGAACACRAACRCESPWPATRQRQAGWLPWIQAGVLSPDGTAVPSRPVSQRQAPALLAAQMARFHTWHQGSKRQLATRARLHGPISQLALAAELSRAHLRT